MLALELESAVTCGIGEGFYFSVVEVAAAVKDHSMDAGGKGTLCDEFADLLCADHIGRRLLEGFVEGGGGTKGAALGIVDDLGVDVLIGIMDGEARSFCGADDFATDAFVNASADRLAVGDAHGAVIDLGLMAAVIGYLPTLLPSLRRTFSPT